MKVFTARPKFLFEKTIEDQRFKKETNQSLHKQSRTFQIDFHQINQMDRKLTSFELSSLPECCG